MERKRLKQVLLKAVLVSVLIQIPFLVMVNAGLHTTFGSIAYIFYFPAVLLVEHMPSSPSHPWQNDRMILEPVLALVQTLILSSLLIPSIFLIQRLSRTQPNRGLD
jgi:hypothetical protein